MLKPGMLGAGLVTIALMSISFACRSEQRTEQAAKPAVHYVEIVTNDVDAAVALYQSMHALSFGQPVADLGQARVATRADGTLVGIRKPAASHEQPIVREYVAVDNIQQAVKQAEQHGATVAYPPTPQGQAGTFAIVVHAGTEYGLWQQ
jgi:predicted enzyme related to lactoylglutathione lyase